MDTHRVANILTGSVDRIPKLVGSDNLRQLLSNVREHVVVRRVGGVCRIEVEASVGAEVPVLVFASNTCQCTAGGGMSFLFGHWGLGGVDIWFAATWARLRVPRVDLAA